MLLLTEGHMIPYTWNFRW